MKNFSVSTFWGWYSSFSSPVQGAALNFGEMAEMSRINFGEMAVWCVWNLRGNEKCFIFTPETAL